MHASSHPAPPSPAGARAFLELEDVACCPVCESPGGRARFLPDVSQCATCRVLYRSPRPTQREIVRSYDAGTTYARWQDERPVRDLLWRKRLRTIARFRPSGDLLDIGTGDGEFLRHAAGAYAVRCTEVSAAGADHVRRRGFEPQIGDFLALDVPEASFDVVTLWHVLEHVPWPGRVLAKVEATLRPGGIVAVAVPNERRPLLWRRRRKRPLGTLGWGEEIHLTHFVPTTLRRTMARVGLRVLEFGVDDVELERSFATGVAHQAHRLVSAVTGWHLGRAMYVVARRTRGGA
ncbi:MAG: class I SAM-dependent methyltransferase [Planctomycetes bacterium]|nr:class I SAM-dependent methyltransferase [Planctomycetota bacterium]